MPLLPLGSNNTNNPGAGHVTLPEVKENPDPLAEFDEYGTELHREARVWKVYVKEADKYDGDLVKGWNDSADVILGILRKDTKRFSFILPSNYFLKAALFSAISSAFLIESSKMLQQDSLLVISQTLLSIANGTQLPGSASPPDTSSTDFTPSRTAIWVNTLWYLSLSLSLATSFIAILAKDWCHSFMKDRTGHPFDQTNRRQKKWDMLVRWKMSELLAFLPSLIHVALLLFAVGLCITLWDTHVVVAVPVICVSGVSFAFYAGSSIAACFVDSFPYPTIFSRMFRSEFRQLLWQLLCEFPFLLGLILNWIAMMLFWILFFPVILIMILNISLDDVPPILRLVVYLLRPAYRGYSWIGDKFDQVIFKKLPQWFKERIPTTAYSLQTVWGRIKSKWGSENNKDRTNNVTSQALGWLIKYCEVPQSVDIALQSIAGATNRISSQPFLECQASLQILRRLASGNLYKSQDTKSGTVVALYVRALSFLGTSSGKNSHERKQGSELEGLIWDLQIEKDREVTALIEKGDFEPTQQNIDALRIGSTVASSSLKIVQQKINHTDVREIFNSIIPLLQYHGTHALHNAALLSLTHAATLLMLFSPASVVTSQDYSEPPLALSETCGNFPELPEASDFANAHTLLLLCTKLSEEHSSGLIASLATTCVFLYNTAVERVRQGGLIWLEEILRGLINVYSQEEDVLKLIYNIEPPGISTSEQAYDLHGYFSRMDSNFSISNRTQKVMTQLASKSNRAPAENIALAELRALLAVRHLTPVTVQTPAIYLLVAEVMCRTPPSSPLFACGAQILSKCPFPTLSEELATALEQRNLVRLLETTSTGDDETKRYFAMGQLWLLLSLCIYAGDTASGRDKLKVELDKWRRDGDESEQDRHRSLGGQLVWEVTPGSTIARDLGVWAWRLEECVRQSRGDDDRDYIDDALRDVPPGLQKLSSFTAWPREAGDPPTNEPQRGEQVAVEVEEGADVVESATQGEDAAAGDAHAEGAGLATDVGEARAQEVGDVGRVDAGENLEPTTLVPKAEAGESVAVSMHQGTTNEGQIKGNDGTQAAGDGQSVAGTGNTVDATDGLQPEGEETENGDAGQGGSNEGDVVIPMDRLEEQPSRAAPNV